MTPMIKYTRSHLLLVERKVTQEWNRVSPQVLETLRTNQICSIKRTHRGRSAGKQRGGNTQPPTITSTDSPTTATTRNWSNLISICTTKSTSSECKSGLTVGSLNIRSARNKSDVIRDTVIDHDLDILSLTETWLTTKEKDDFYVKGLALSGYEFHHVPREGNNGYGGVGVLYKKSLKVIKKGKVTAKTFENLQIKFNTGSRCLDLVTVYRPPPSAKNKHTPAEFLTEFSAFLQDKVTGSGDLLLVGDLNFHLDKKMTV